MSNLLSKLPSLARSAAATAPSALRPSTTSPAVARQFHQQAGVVAKMPSGPSNRMDLKKLGRFAMEHHAAISDGINVMQQIGGMAKGLVDDVRNRKGKGGAG